MRFFWLVVMFCALIDTFLCVIYVIELINVVFIWIFFLSFDCVNLHKVRFAFLRVRILFRLM